MSDGVQTIPSTTSRFSTAAAATGSATGSSAGATCSTTSGASSESEDSSSLLVVLSPGPSSAALSRVRLRAFHALSLGGLSHLTTHFVAGPAPSFSTISPCISAFEACLPNSCVAPLAPSIFVAFAFTRTPILKPFAIENSVIAAIKKQRTERSKSRMRSGRQRAELCLSRASLSIYYLLSNESYKLSNVRYPWGTNVPQG